MRIELKGGHCVEIDDEDYLLVKDFRWYSTVIKGGHDLRYASSVVSMHRLIMGLAPDDERVVDHRDGNGLNNRKENLRAVTVAQNSKNRRKQVNSSSRYKGVRLYDPQLRKPWKAQIYVNGRSLHLGYFATEDEAGLAYNQAAREHYGEFAWLNQIG